LADYAEYSTIMGLVYLFFSYQTTFGQIFWIITVILMTILGLYWCIEAYIQWRERPVLTTIRTTAYAVKSVRNILTNLLFTIICKWHHILFHRWKGGDKKCQKFVTDY
jgi:hypothetical protein